MNEELSSIRSLPSGHQQLVSVIDSAESIRRSTKVRMMLLDQLPEGLLDRLLGSIRL